MMMMMMHPWRSRFHLKIHLNPYFTYVDTTYDYTHTQNTYPRTVYTYATHTTIPYVYTQTHAACPITPRPRFYIGQTRVSYSRAHTH